MKGRLRFLSIGIIAFALILVGKLYQVQVVNGDSFRSKADRQYVASPNFFDRGTIYFTTKDGDKVSAAAVKKGSLLAIDPTALHSASSTDAIYERVNAIVPIDKSVWDEKLSHQSRYEELAHELDSSIGSQITALKIPGVSAYKQDWRVYPGQSMAAHALGIVGYGGDNNNELAGRYGLERYYEPTLVRSDTSFVNFFAEVFSDIKKTILSDQSLEGDVVTTIEPNVEATLERELQSVEDEYHSEFTGGIVIDPNTGKIYAMTLNPTFDPNDPGSADSSAVFRNKLVEDRYEMGSIVKALTMAAGLDSGAVTLNTTYNDPGCETIDKKTFCNYDGRSHGTAVTMQDVLNHSLNTGAAFVAKQMGNDTFRKYFLAYGLASTTGIDLPSEGNSLVSNLFSPRDLEYAQASFGQGIALTPVQITRALSVIANGGHLVTPHLVEKIEYKVGGWKDINPEPGPSIFKPGTTEEISRMLTQVVDVALRNGTVRLPNYSVAAKTGTAQIASPDGGYYPDHYLHSFFGYFPSFDPKFLIFLYTYYPKDVQYASETLTTSFMDLTKFLISYYNIPPDREKVPNY